MAENLTVETDNQAKASDAVAQSEKDSVIVATEQNEVVANEQAPKLPETVEEFEKALQSASSKKMNEFMKKYGATKLSDIEDKLSNISALETQIKESGESASKSKELEDKITELQKIIDEQTPIIKQKQQADFLNQNNINPEFAEDFFALYEKKLSEDKSNSEEVIKQILEKHPNMGAFKFNEIKTSVKTSEKKQDGDGLNNLRKKLGLPLKNL